jgi:hypothetical protein
MRSTTTAAIALLIAGVGLVVLSNFLFFAMVSEINAISKPEDQVDLFFANTKMGQIIERYGELRPNSRRGRHLYIAGIGGLALAFVAFLLLIYGGSS